MAGEVGTVVLGGVTFTADPVGFVPDWAKRATEFQGVGGWNVIQDWGMEPKDLKLRLQSGAGGPLAFATMKALKALHRVKGATYAYADSFGNQFSVFMLEYQEALRVGGGTGGLWDYTMTLSVRTITKLYGDTP